MDLKSIKSNLNKVIEDLEALDNFKEDTPIKFVRWLNVTAGGWREYSAWSTWKVLLDESKNRICVRDSQGFKIEHKRPNMEIIYCTEGTKDLILSKDKKSRDMGSMILTELAKEKYGQKE